jgi:predicted component of type VI protein secretion system
MSRSHCKIEQTTTGHRVVDLGSRNGTFVNGVQAPEQELKSGDVLKIGNIPVTYEAAPPPAKAVPAPKPRPAPPPPLIEVMPEAATLDAIPEELKAPKPKVTKRVEAEPRPVSGVRKGRKSRYLPMLFAAGFLVTGAVLFILYRSARAKSEHDQDVKARLKADIGAINELSPSDSIGRDALVEKLIANVEYEAAVPETVKKLRGEHDKLHAAAEADRKAAPIVEPFLARYAKAIKSPESLAPEAQPIFDESKTLLEKYGDGTYADRLLAIRTELKGYLEKKK